MTDGTGGGRNVETYLSGVGIPSLHQDAVTSQGKVPNCPFPGLRLDGSLIPRGNSRCASIFDKEGA